MRHPPFTVPTTIVLPDQHTTHKTLIIKFLRKISDKSVVEQWSESAYFQYFYGKHDFTPPFPCDTREPIHFRKRIGEKGIELILAESIRVNDEKSNEGTLETHDKN